jgi:hypothetical protein
MCEARGRGGWREWIHHVGVTLELQL